MLAAHMNVFAFLTALAREQAVVAKSIARLEAGHPPPPIKRENRNREQRIRTVVTDYGNRDRIDFLRGIAHNIVF